MWKKSGEIQPGKADCRTKRKFFFISADLKCAISIKDLGKRVINLGGLIAWRHLSTSEIFGAILKGSFQCVLSNQSNAF